MGANKVILVGRVGATPEVHYFEGGGCVARVSLATNEWYRDKRGESHQMTEWHRLALWNRLAESAERFLQKGTLVYVEGRLTYRSWEDRNKQPHRVAEIQVQRILYLDGRASSVSEGEPKEASAEEKLHNIEGLGEEPILPF